LQLEPGFRAHASGDAILQQFQLITGICLPAGTIRTQLTVTVAFEIDRGVRSNERTQIAMCMTTTGTLTMSALLTDPLIRMVMRSDGVSEDDFTALLFRVKDTLEQRYGSEATLELLH
jgi:hypothetical protein